MEQQVYQEFNELEGQHWWFRGRRKYLRRLISSYLSPSSRARSLCEIGSGTGGNLPMLTEFGSVDAVEMDDNARHIIENKKVPGVRLVQGGSLPDHITLDEAYDGVFSLDVIEHVEDDLAALIRLRELLSADGLLFTTVPAYQWLWSAHDDANHHKRRYTKSAYCELLQRAGFEIRYASYFNSLLFPLAVIERLMSKLKPGRKRNDKATLTMPAGWLNRVFYGIFGIESAWAGKLRFPFGLSIAVVAAPIASSEINTALIE